MDEQTKEWLRHTSYSNAQRFYYEGRISEAAWVWYCSVWRNSAFRYSNIEQQEQHRSEAAFLACEVCKAEGLKFDPIAMRGE